jgi:CDP-ribitol ribitolphosphotransferase
MESRKRIIRQHIKSALQKTLLPLCYKLSKKKDIDKKLVILADLNSVSTPESMELIKAELQSRGYKVREMYCDLSSCGMVSGLKYMMSFMKAYANARAVFICNYFVPVTSCKKREETTVVQLWHSCGALKKFGYDSEEDISSHFKGYDNKYYEQIGNKHIDITNSIPFDIPLSWQWIRLGTLFFILKSKSISKVFSANFGLKLYLKLYKFERS